MAGGAPTRKLAELFYDIRARTEGLEKDLGDSERQLGKFSAYVMRNPVAATAALGVAVLGVGLKAASMAAEVESSMRRVQASTGGGLEGVQRLQREITALSVASGIAIGDLARAAELAAKSSENTVETGDRLRAAVQVATATGGDVTTVLEGLDQVLDLFNLKGSASAEVLAELFSAAKGKQPLEDLFAEFQAAAPGIQQLNIDLPTAARALVALGESGRSPKQAAAALKELAKEGAEGRKAIDQLAASIPRAADPAAELAAAFTTAANSSANLNARLRAELGALLIDLGQQLLPLVNAGLRTMLGLVEALRGAPSATSIGKAFETIAANAEAASTAARSSKDWFDANVRVGQSLQVLSVAAKQGQDVFVGLGRDGVGAVIAQLERLRERSAREGLELQVKQLDALIARAKDAQRTLSAIPKATDATASSPTAAAEAAAKAAEQRRKEAQRRAKEDQEEWERQLNEWQRDREQQAQAASDALSRLAETERTRRLEVLQALVKSGRATAATFVEIFRLTEEEIRAAGFEGEDIPIIRDARLGIRSLQGDLAALQDDLASVLGHGLRELNTQVDDANKKRADAAKKTQTDADRALTRAQSVGRKVEDIGRLTLSAADAFGVLSDEATKALQAVIDVGAGIARIASGDVAGGLAQGIAGVVSLAGQAFGKDPAAEERRREHEENLAALRAIERHTGDLVGLTQSGRSIASVTSAVESLLSRTGSAGGFRKFSDFGINEAALLEGITGQSFKEIEALAKSLGITLNGTKQSYLDFLAALKGLDLEAFGADFAGQVRQLEIEARLDPAAFAGIEGLLKRLQVLAGPEGAPAIARALEGLDLRTTEGRAAAIERLSTVLRTIGSLDVEDLGGLSLDQFIEEILGVVDGLRAAEPAVATAGERLRAALATLETEFEALDLTAVETRTTRLAELLGAFVPALADVTTGLDATDLASVEAADARLRDLFARRDSLTAAERGGLSLEEFTAALLQLDGALDRSRESLTGARAQLLEEARQAEEAHARNRSESERAAEAERARLVEERLTRARRESALLDEGPQAQLQRLITALGELSPVFRDLLSGLDLAQPADLLLLDQRLQALFTQIGEGGVDAALRGSLSLSELIEQLLAVESGADAVASGLAALAQEAATTADRLAAAVNDLQFGLELRNITDPIERLVETARALRGVDPRVGAALQGVDLRTSVGRAFADAALQQLGAGTTDTGLRDTVLELLRAIRAVPDAVAAGVSGGTTVDDVRQAATVLSGTPQITSVQADRWLSFAATQTDLLRQIAQNTLPIAALFAPVPPGALLQPPALPLPSTRTGSTAGSVVIRVEQTNHFGSAPSDVPGTARLLTDEMLRQISEGLETLRDRERLQLGDTAR